MLAHRLPRFRPSPLPHQLRQHLLQLRRRVRLPAYLPNEFSLSVQTNVLHAFGVSPQPGNPPSFSQISAVALLLTSLPSHFHTPIYERAMLLFKQHPLLAPTPMDEEVSLLTSPLFIFFPLPASNVLMAVVNRASASPLSYHPARGRSAAIASRTTLRTCRRCWTICPTADFASCTISSSTARSRTLPSTPTSSGACMMACCVLC